MPKQAFHPTWVDDPAAAIDIPEPMVMQRADDLSKGYISYVGSMAKPGRIIKSKRTALASSPNGDNTTDTVRGASFHSYAQSHNIQSQKPLPQTTGRGNTDENSGGFLSAPLAWVQRQRELRRRLQLQQEAEEQLRKIAEAELIRRNGDSSVSTYSNGGSGAGGAGSRGGKNPYCNSSLPGNWFSGNDSSDEELKIGTQQLSKSGEGMTAELTLDDDDEEDDYVVPMVRILAEPRLMKAPSDDSIESPWKSDSKSQTYILTPEQMHQIAVHVLPRGIAYCPWRRVYSLSRDGDSFDGCLRIISDVPRTLLVIRTTRGAVFGGYADSPWRSVEMGNARFYGSAQACLFSVKDPDQSFTNSHGESPSNLLNVYPWSGKNRYIQLCDMSSKMLAFGGGGADGAFGLCVQEDFQTGSTGPCDTFDNAPLCDQDTFEIVDVEFWEFMTGVF